MNSLAARSFDTHMKILRWTGYSKLRTGNVFLRILHQLFRFIVLSTFTIYIIQEILYITLDAIDLEAFARAMLLLLLHLATFAKMAVFCLREDKIITIIEDFNDPLMNPKDEALRDILTQSVITTKRVVKTFVSTSFFSSTLWSIFPVIDFVTGKKVQYYFWLSDINYNTSPAFELSTLYTSTLVTLFAVSNTALDAFIPAILAQCKTQLTILRHNLEHLPETCKELAKDNSVGYEEVLLKELNACINHYEKIVQITKKHESVFGVVLFLQFGCSGWIICMTMYKLVNVQLLTLEFMSLVFFMTCMLIEIFLFCYYGNEVKFESERISESVYAMSWPATPRSFRRSLLVVMERAKRPISPTAGFIIPLSLETFMKVLKSSYSFYAVLREVK